MRFITTFFTVISLVISVNCFSQNWQTSFEESKQLADREKVNFMAESMIPVTGKIDTDKRNKIYNPRGGNVKHSKVIK